jgi:hypothetical protein
MVVDARLGVPLAESMLISSATSILEAGRRLRYRGVCDQHDEPDVQGCGGVQYRHAVPGDVRPPRHRHDVLLHQVGRQGPRETHQVDGVYNGATASPYPPACSTRRGLRPLDVAPRRGR